MGDRRRMHIGPRVTENCRASSQSVRFSEPGCSDAHAHTHRGDQSVGVAGYHRAGIARRCLREGDANRSARPTQNVGMANHRFWRSCRRVSGFDAVWGHEARRRPLRATVSVPAATQPGVVSAISRCRFATDGAPGAQSGQIDRGNGDHLCDQRQPRHQKPSGRCPSMRWFEREHSTHQHAVADRQGWLANRNTIQRPPRRLSAVRRSLTDGTAADPDRERGGFPGGGVALAV